MTAPLGTITDDSPESIRFRELKDKTDSPSVSALVGEYGTVYVTAITRQGCSGCETQKPLFEALASRLGSEGTAKIKFRRVHIDYGDDNKQESWDGKRVFGHAAYPTYMIHVKSHVGPLEVYRSIYPPMEELEKQIRGARELAEFYRGEAQKIRVPNRP